MKAASRTHFLEAYVSELPKCTSFLQLFPLVKLMILDMNSPLSVYQGHVQQPAELVDICVRLRHYVLLEYSGPDVSWYRASQLFQSE